MAAPKDSVEQAFRLRKFQGTNTQIDSTYLGPSFVARTENWIPTQSYRIGVRPGHSTLAQMGNVQIPNLLACHAFDGTSYLYAYTVLPGSQPGIQQSANEGAFSGVPGATFPTAGTPGRMVQFRDRVYAGNGVDPLMMWKIGDPTPAVHFTNITNTGPPAGSPSATAPTAPAGADTVPAGTYTYAWAVFDTSSGLYVSRSDPATITVPAQATLSFVRPPAAVLPLVNRLFVSPRNYPIEYATMQATGTTTAALPDPVTLATVDVTDTRVPMAGGSNVFRSGNMLFVWTNRVVFAGFSQDRYSVFATDVILPGLEQAAFNQGTLFPDFAKVPLPGIVTGIGVAGVSSDYNASAPLLFFTSSRTFLVQGDPFDPAGSANLVELSSRVGCIGHDSIVHTPYGTIFCGIDSVYLIPPGGGYPQDIGWPIADQIRQIPVGARQSICATFHKQFYKLAILGTGSGLGAQWWLDLRQGVTDAPSWWGPHTGVNITAMASDPDSSLEVDRGYVAAVTSPPLAPTTAIFRSHQIGLYQENIPGSTTPYPIRSVLQSGRFDADQPFIPKIFTRLRLICASTAKSALHVRLVADAGKTTVFDPILVGQDMDPPGQFVHLVFGESGEPPPPNRTWNIAQFGSVAPVEVQTIAPYTRPRALSAVITISHDPAFDAADNDPTTLKSMANLELRDFELLFIFSERKVRFLGERVS